MMQTDVEKTAIPEGRRLALPMPILAVGVLAVMVFLRQTIQLVVHRDMLGGTGDDFHFYWEAVQRFRADPHTLYVPGMQMDLRGFLYPPPAIGLFLPLASLSHGVAGVVFRIAGLLAMVGSVWILSDLFRLNGLNVRTRDRLCFLVVALAFGATFTNVWYGQVNTFVLLDCLAFRWLLDRNKPAAAGAVLAAGVWLKIYPIFCLLLVVWEFKRPGYRASLPRLLGGFAASFVGIAVILLPLVPLSLYGVYLTDTLPAISGRTFQNILNQSLQGAAARTLGPAANFYDWDKCGFSVVPQTWARILNGAVAVTAGVLLVRVAQTASHMKRLVGFFCLLAAIPVLSPLGWSYVYVLATPALLLAVLSTPRTVVGLLVLLAFAGAFFIPATHELPHVLTRLPDVFQHMIYDRYMLLTVTVGGWLLLDPQAVTGVQSQACRPAPTATERTSLPSPSPDASSQAMPAAPRARSSSSLPTS
jgi:hypothetical protein